MMWKNVLIRDIYFLQIHYKSFVVFSTTLYGWSFQICLIVSVSNYFRAFTLYKIRTAFLRFQFTKNEEIVEIDGSKQIFTTVFILRHS